MILRTLVVLVTSASLIGLSASLAGDLEPSGPPESTMVTLRQIYDKLDLCIDPQQCGVPKTGQSECWDGDGNPIDCSGTGQDGEYQAGILIDPRFTDNGDWTITDNMTELVWMKITNCYGYRTWSGALAEAAALADGICSLADGSVPGDWRLPNVKELLSLLDYGESQPSLPPGHPFWGVMPDHYWTSTSTKASPAQAWIVSFANGYCSPHGKFYNCNVWAVRGGL